MSSTVMHGEQPIFPIIRDGIVYDLLQAEDVEGAARCLAVTFTASDHKPQTTVHRAARGDGDD